MFKFADLYGVATNLTDGINSGKARSVFVLGADVYAAGFEETILGSKAIIWKNGVATNLTDGSTSAFAYSVSVSGQDVFSVGIEYNGGNPIAKLWKNGVGITLGTGNISDATSVFVHTH